MKTLAQMLCSMSMDTKSVGSSFCRSDRLKLQKEDPCSNALFDVNVNGVFILYISQTTRSRRLKCFVRSMNIKSGVFVLYIKKKKEHPCSNALFYVMNTKSMGSSFCRSDRFKLQKKDPCSNGMSMDTKSMGFSFCSLSKGLHFVV